MPTRAAALFARESKTSARKPRAQSAGDARTAESTRAAARGASSNGGDGVAATTARPQSISSRNASNLTYSYLQDMRAAPLTSPARDDIGSDIDGSSDDDFDGGDFRVQRRGDGGGDAEADDDYIRRLRAHHHRDGQDHSGRKKGFGSSSPTKRLASPAPPVDNPWVPTSGARARSRGGGVGGGSGAAGSSTFRHGPSSSSLVRELMHAGSSRVDAVADLEAQIKDLRVQINKMSATSPRAAARARARFDAEVLAEGGGGGGGGGGGDGDGGTDADGGADPDWAARTVPASDPSHPDFFSSVRRDYGSPGAGSAGPNSTWAERVRRQFEDEGLLDAEADRRAAAAEAAAAAAAGGGGAGQSGVGKLHTFGNKKITIPQPFTRMERHAIAAAEKDKMKQTDHALRQAQTGGSRRRGGGGEGEGEGESSGDFDAAPVPEQAGSSHRFDDHEADLINRIQGRAAFAVKPKKIAEAAYLNLCHKGSTTRSHAKKVKGMALAPQALRRQPFRANYPAPAAGITLEQKTEREAREREERIRQRSRAVAEGASLPPRMDRQLRQTGRHFTGARQSEEAQGQPSIKRMPDFAKLHHKWDNFKRATLKTKSPTRPADFSFNRRSSSAYKTREDIMRAKAARKSRMEEREGEAERRRQEAVAAAAAAAMYQEPSLRAKTTKTHQYRVLKTQRMLDERRQKEFAAEEQAEERLSRNRQASQQVTRHYREQERQRRQKYEDEGKLNIYEMADPSYVSDERARERAETARRDYQERLRDFKETIQEAVANGPHIVDRLEIEEKRQEAKDSVMTRYPGV